jgi:hypothetical protein
MISTSLDITTKTVAIWNCTVENIRNRAFGFGMDENVLFGHSASFSVQ